MSKAKGRKNLTDRRGFVALALAAFGASVSAPLPARAVESRKTPSGSAKTAARPEAAHPPQRARLPRRLAADFHQHIKTRLPALRPSFEAAGRETGLSWRLLAALGYQESKWRAAAVSPRGAQGIMMLMPITATKMGVKNVFVAEENINGGARYLQYMKERIPKRILDPDRTWLAMAAPPRLGASALVGGPRLGASRIGTHPRGDGQARDPNRVGMFLQQSPRVAARHRKA